MASPPKGGEAIRIYLQGIKVDVYLQHDEV